MTAFPGSPKNTKGALIGLDAANPVASVILFQYNPLKMTRTIQPQTSGGEGSIFETQRLEGAPVETIRLEVELDAADKLEQGEILQKFSVLYPQLSALEMLVYPKSALVIANTSVGAGDHRGGPACRAADPVRLGPAARFAGAPDRIHDQRRGL